MKYIYKNNEIQVFNDKDEQVGRAKIPFESDNIINVTSVFIDPSLRGGGEASKLMNEVYEFAKREELLVKNTCPYAVAWFKRNKDKHDVLADQQPDEACEL